jgi:hypothetical protein
MVLPHDQLRSLWGCMVVDYGFSLVNHTVWMSVYCPSSERSYSCRIELSGVISFHLDANYPSVGADYLREPWSYIELTSVDARPLNENGEQTWEFSAELWSSNLSVRCLNIQITHIPWPVP